MPNQRGHRGVISLFESASYPAPSPQEIEAFVATQFCGKVIATAPGGLPHVSILPFVPQADGFEVHMVRGDPTLDALEATGRGAFLLDEPLAFTPHHVVSADHGGMATLHFRAVLFQVHGGVDGDPRHVAAALERLLLRYEPDCLWSPVTDGPLYGRDLRRLAVARLRTVGVEAKFKVAQNRTPEDRGRLLAFLRTRGLPGDARAVRVIQEANGLADDT